MNSRLEVAQRTFAVAPSDHAVRGAATITADATRMYATGGKGILVIDAHSLSRIGVYLPDVQFASVMVSADGTRLYALTTEGAIHRIEPSSGRDLGVIARLPNALSIARVE